MAVFDTTEARFWSKVDRSGECWLWLGYQMPRGYGRFRLDGTVLLAHRASYLLFVGPINDERLLVCHKCDTPSCVRPDHLFLGTAAENVDDARIKGRAKRSVKTPSGQRVSFTADPLTLHPSLHRAIRAKYNRMGKSRLVPVKRLGAIARCLGIEQPPPKPNEPTAAMLELLRD